MYTIISATHRPGSNTLKIARQYLHLLKEQGVDAQVLSLEDLPHDFIFSDTFGARSERFQQIIDKYLVPVQKFILVAPEYNGGMPGILTAFIDAAGPESFKGKKVALVGVAAGRGGNSRGMDQQSNRFHYLGVHVYHHLVAISEVLSHLNEKGELKTEAILSNLKKQAEGFVVY
jgi:NAD(P)H-dependent FMN reductase